MNSIFNKIINLYALLLSAALISIGAAQADAFSHKASVRGVITEMNQAITDRDVDRLLETFADNAVKFNLHRAHGQDKDVSKLTAKDQISDLAIMWKSVSQILFPSTRFYERTAIVMDVHIDKEMAVIWATINTRSQSIKEGADINTNSFSEVYLLVLIEEEWKIATITNNRKDKYPNNK